MNRQTGYLAMPTLQIRDLPQELYQHLALRAEREHRSLAQQALVDLQQACQSNTPANRRRVIAAIRADLADAAKTAEVAHERYALTVATPEQLVRADRDR
jgi:plasmid stability protein